MLLNWENQEYVCKTVEVDIIVSFLLPRITPKTTVDSIPIPTPQNPPRRMVVYV